MKINFLKTVILVFGLSLTPAVSFAAPLFSTTATGGHISDVIPVVGRIDNATQSWSGSLITNFDTSRTPVSNIKSSEMYFDNMSNTFSGFFVLTAACSTTDCKKPSTNDWDESAFVTFNHGVSSFEAKFGVPTGDVYPMIGFAWSKSSGWIAFNVGPNPVKYNRTTGLFSGFAWSKNLGYISMNGLQMVTQVPMIVNNSQNVTVANHNATLGSNSGSVNGLDGYSLDINKWNDSNIDLLSNNDPKSSTDGSFTGVDVRLAKDYSYKITDPFGNYSSGVLKVVANTPESTLLAGYSIGSGLGEISGELISDTSSISKKANGIDEHSMTINLHDQYGNKVQYENGIKNIVMTIVINNSMDLNTTNIDDIDLGLDTSVTDEHGRAITFSGGVKHPIFTDIFETERRQNSGAGNSYSYVHSGAGDVNGTIRIKSYFPTNNTLTYSLQYSVVGSMSGVGELVNPPTKNGSWNFDQLWSGSYDLYSVDGGKFGLNLPFKTSGSFTSTGSYASETLGNTHHLYRTATGSTWVSVVTFTGADDPSISSQKFGEWFYTNQGEKTDFQFTPKIIDILSGSTIDFDLQHQTIRRINTPSDPAFDPASIGMAYPISQSFTGVTQNRGIKILGSASSGNKDAIFALNDTDTYAKVGNFRKPQVRDMVTQNVEALKRNTPSDVLVASGSITKLSQITNIDNYKTVIVQGRDFTIDQNLWLSSVSPKALIVLGGDVIIDSNVQKIHASIFTDKGIKASGALSDKQLYIYGTLISGNTIGTTAKLANTVCPDFLGTSCSETDKKAYDLNFLRSGATGASSYLEYSLVIEYNPKLTSDPPPGFKKIAR